MSGWCSRTTQNVMVFRVWKTVEVFPTQRTGKTSFWSTMVRPLWTYKLFVTDTSDITSQDPPCFKRPLCHLSSPTDDWVSQMWSCVSKWEIQSIPPKWDKQRNFGINVSARHHPVFRRGFSTCNDGHNNYGHLYLYQTSSHRSTGPRCCKDSPTSHSQLPTTF